jgi:hypothetical protein
MLPCHSGRLLKKNLLMRTSIMPDFAKIAVAKE